MKISDEIERAFSARQKPALVRLAEDVRQVDFETEEALWFSGRDWHELTWQDWREHSSAIYFFDAEAFAYYLPSVLLLSALNPSQELEAADFLVSELDRSPDPDGWTEGFRRRFLGLNPSELNVLKEWLLVICEYSPYGRGGMAASGPGDAFGRAFDTLDLLHKEVQRKRNPNN